MELCDQYIHELIQLIPELNDFFQLPEYDHLRSKFSNPFTREFLKKERALVNKYYIAVSNKEPKSLYDTLFLNDLKKLRKETRYLVDNCTPIDSLNNFPLDLISALQGETSSNFKTDRNYLDYIERFKGVAEMTDCIIKNMRQGIKKKDTLSKIVVLDMIKQYNHFLSSDISSLLVVPSTVLNKVIKSIQTYLIPNIQKLVSFLETDYVCHSNKVLGLCGVPMGKQAYREILQSNTLQGYTPQDIHKLGIREVKRITNKLLQLKRKMKFKGTLASFYEINKRPFKTKQEILALAKQQQESIYEKIYKRYFEPTLSKSEVSNIRSIQNKQSLHYAFYVSSKYKGTFYVNTNHPEELNKNEMKTLTLHESIPGHHLQQMTHNHSKQVPLYVQLADNDGYIEGWGLYCENFTDLHTNKELIEKYLYELHRAIRLVVDTGIHAFKWSYKHCFDYMKHHLTISDRMIHNEIIRYICIPTQALSYKVGELTLLFLRDKYLSHYPNDIKGFHKLIFDIGPCPLDHLIKECIKKNI